PQRRIQRAPARLHTGLLLACLLLAGAACTEKRGTAGTQSQSAPTATAFTVSGTIPVTAGSAIDGDVNDPSAAYDPNDTPATAQEIANPVTLGGYANVPGTGASGRSQIGGDAFDYYRAALAAGQRVRLFLAEDGAVNDLDLALLRLDGSPVATRDGSERVMEIDVPDSDVYLIEVSASSGASNYVLTVGQAAAASAAAAELEPEFVPGELIIAFRDEAARRSAGNLGVQRMRDMPNGASLVRCDDEGERHRAMSRLGMAHLVPESPRAQPGDARVRLRRETRRLAKALRRDPEVRAASLNYVRKAHAVPTDEYYDLQWHFDRINLPLAWDNLLALDPAERAPDPVVVAVIDTGIVSTHPDLQGQLVPGYDFIQSPSAASDGDGCDANPEDLGDGLISANSSFHGTHVAGTVVARTSLSGGGSAGVAGAAFDARVMPLRALGIGGGTDFDIMQAVRYAAGLPNDCGVLPAARADVINMSLGGGGFNPVFQDLIDEVRMAGVTVVASAGNNASSAPSYPAAFGGVISVSATDLEDGLASYSNFGPTIDLAAPGGELAADANGDGFADGVLSTWVDANSGDPIYGFAQGTSMAAPHVSGVIALMLDVNPALNPFDIDQLIAQGALTQNIGSVDSFGQGRIDAFAAISAAFETEGGSPPVNAPRLDATPSPLDFGTLASALSLELSNVGGDDETLVVNAVQTETADGGNWLTAVPVATDGNGVGTWSIQVDRGALGSAEIYSGTLMIDTSHNDLEVAVIVRTRALDAESDAGHHFVLLVDPDTLGTVIELQVDISGGAYDFRFQNVEPGSYLIVAGTDSDNDSVICDAGEACGAYPARDDLEPLEVDRNINNAGFATGFSTAFEAAMPGATPGGGFSRLSGR
ncbi:MAG: S8 family serine peptidase, partial [Myxococcota bacterium]